jgi:amino acid adenylation domain-containing protein
MEGEKKAYQISGAVRLQGALDTELFVKAFQEVVIQHESLRTLFKKNSEGIAQQYILEPEAFVNSTQIIDLTGKEHPETEALALILQKQERVFDLAEAPLFESVLLQTTATEAIYYLSMHHLISDGWSLEVLTRTVFEYYQKLTAGETIQHSETALQFKDYAHWLATQEQTEKYIKAAHYWVQQFQENVPVLQLPEYQKRPAVKTFNGQQYRHTFTTSLTDQLKNIAKEHQVTLFTTLMSAVNVLLARYSNQQEIIVGTPIAGREHPDLEDQIGLYINTLAIKSEIAPKATLSEILKKKGQELLEAYAHQQYPFDQLVDRLSLQRDTSRAPLFDVMVVLQNQRQLTSFTQQPKDITITPFDIPVTTAQFDIVFTFVEADNLQLNIVYNTDIYAADFIQNIGEHLENIFTEIITHPECKVAEIDLVTEAERNILLQEFNRTSAPFPNATVIELFQENVIKTPEHTAVTYQNTSISYRELDVLSNRLANYLISQHHVHTGDLVVLLLNRSENIVVAILAVMKAGSAYVPVDPTYPAARIQDIVEDVSPKVIIDDTFLQEFLNIEDIPETTPQQLPNENDTAYVIFTSGSSGKPKGVVITHKGLTNFVWAYNLKKSRSSLTGNYVFDVTVMEIFTAMISGSTLVIPEKETVMAPEAYANFLYECKITHCYIPPMHVDAVAEALAEKDQVFLERIMVGVEGIKKESIAWFLDHGVEVMNAYGPSETTVCTSFYHVNTLEEITTFNLPIGKPLPNFQVHILNEHSQLLQPLGVIGELCVSGIGLAKGYWNRPDLTEEKFIPNPFVEGAKLYKTGDLARWLPDGNIEFIGRKDHQVKLHGYRIELEEIEHALESWDEISDAVVLVREKNGEKSLIAYLISEPIELHQLRAELNTVLPQYMVPNYYVFIDKVPLTVNGKTDRKALLQLENIQTATREYIPPQSETEKQMAVIWQRILDVERVGLTDNFFELGGDSMKSVKLSNALQKELGYQISINDIFEKPTIGELCKDQKKHTHNAIPLAPQQDDYPVTPSQKRMWVLSRFSKGNEAYNIPNVLELKGKLDIALFQQAVQQAVIRHESLRTIFKEDESGELRQYILPEEDSNIAINIHENLNASEVQNVIATHYKTPFDLAKAPLFSIAIIRKSATHALLLFNMHHSIGDGWSMEVLCREIISDYNTLYQGNELLQKELPIQYKDYAVWLENELNTAGMERSKAFWLDQFSDAIPVLELPTKASRPKLKTYTGDTVTYQFSDTFGQLLTQFTKAHGATVFMGLMAGLKGLLYRYTGQTDMVLGTPVAGREHPDLEHQIGVYLNTLAIRSTFENGHTLQELLQIQKENLREAYAHQSYPFDLLVDDLNLKREVSRSPLFDVLIAFQNYKGIFRDDMFAIEDASITLYPTEARKTSQFDMSFIFMSEAELFNLTVEYNTDLFTADFVEKMATHLENFMIEGMQHPSKTLSEIQYLTSAESKLLLETYTNTRTLYPKNQNLLTLFQEQVAINPHKTALIFEETEWSYAKLDEVSSQLANYLLHNFDIQSEERIAVILERNHWVIVSILAILKAGGAYVPIDHDLPKERTDFILTDCDINICIDETVLEAFQTTPTKHHNTPTITSDSENLAYVMYTSGSTGMPKGTLIEQKSIIRLVKNTNYIDFDTVHTILVTGSVSFDATTFEFWGALLNGGTLVLCPKAVLLDIRKMGALIKARKVDTMWFTAGLLHQFVDQDISIFAPLKNILAGGDKLSVKHIKKLLNTYPEIQLINGYGPTENTTFSICHPISKGEIPAHTVPLGKAISNTACYILDHNLHPVPVGVVGEICLSGDGLSRGYLNQPELTAEKFIAHPFISGERMYKTGDLGKWLPDGTVEFMGRKDDQVKIRGHRIELGEIEHHLEQKEGINEAVVLVHQQENDHKELVAYLSTKVPQELTELKMHVLEKLPEYMLPATFMVLEQFPINKNGKVDRKQLRKAKGTVLKSTEKHLTARNATEAYIIEIWQRVLGIKEISVADNFFDLGGHSLKVSRLLYEYQEHFEATITMEAIFLNPTVAAQAILIDASEKKHTQPIPKVPQLESYPVTDTQKNIWITSQYSSSEAAYHMPFFVIVNMEQEPLEKAFQKTIERHEILRTVFRQDTQTGELRQWIQDTADIFSMATFDYRNVENKEKAISTYAVAEMNRAFDLENGPLLRATLFRTEHEKSILYFNMHHIISDGWSMEVLIQEVLAQYQAITGNTETTLSELPVQFKDFVVWNQEQQQLPDFEAHRTYWNQQFAGELPKTNLQIARSRPTIKTYNGASFTGEISRVAKQALTQLNKNFHTSTYMNMLALIRLVLYKYSLQKDMIIGSPVAGREHTDLKG